MYILLKYDYEQDERIILGYKVSNDINYLLSLLPSKPNLNEIVTIWPGDFLHQYIVLIDYNRIDEVKNKFYSEAIKLAKQCMREYNLIKILEK